MSFLSKLLPAAGTAIGATFGMPQVGGLIGSAAGSLLQGSGAGAASQAAAVQQQAANQAAGNIETAGQQAGGLFDPFQQAAQQGVNNAGFLTDPSQQFQFLQNNPLFQMGLDNANQVTQQSAAAQGRLSSGDTLQQLTNNSLLTAQPLIDRQRQDILGLLNLGTGVAGQQAGILQNTALNAGNLRTSGSAAQAAGIVGASNAQQDQFGNMVNIGTQLAGNQDFTNLFSGFGGSSPAPSVAPQGDSFTGGADFSNFNFFGG